MELLFLLLLIVLMTAALGSGFPVAFALPGSAILTIAAASLAGYLFAGDVSAYFAQGGPVEWLSAGVTNFRGIYWEVERDTLIAIPLFVFMGIMLQRSKIAEDLLVTMAQLFGPMPGGLGISVVFVGALLAATTGIVGATVVAMGLISLPAMLRNSYSHPLATGTIAASGTLGQIIPPSIVLIILADQLASAVDQASTSRKALYKEATGEFNMPSAFDVVSTSAGDMFMGAIVPGLILVGFYMAYILGLALLSPKSAPAVHFEGKYDRNFAIKVFLALVPPLTLIFVVLGSIIMGVATVNQAGAIGAVGATIMAGYRLYQGKRGTYSPAILAIVSVVALIVIANVAPINVKNLQSQGDVIALICAGVATTLFLISVIWSLWRAFTIDDTLRGVMIDTAKTTSLVFIILLGAAMLTAAFRAFGGEELVREFLTELPGGFWAQFVIVMLVIFVLGFFLDFIEIAVVVVPIVAPILLADPSANITAVWLGVMIGLNIQTSFLTPPFGFALFYLRGVAPAAVRTISMYKGVVPFIMLQLLALVVVGFTPALVNYLPTRISLTSETAPPPVNPRLQYCMENYVFAEYETQGQAIRDAIAAMRDVDLSYLPKDRAKDITEALDKAESTFGLLTEINAADAAVRSVEAEYRPLHTQVRRIERDIAQHDEKIAAIQKQMGRLRDNPERVQALELETAELTAERDSLAASIPSDWDAEHAAFAELQKAETQARSAYRRTVDEAYAPIQESIAVLSATPVLISLENELQSLGDSIRGGDPEVTRDRISEVSSLIGGAEGSRDIRSSLTKASRALRGDSPDREEALESLAKAQEAFEEDVTWRERAQTDLLPALVSYEAAIRSTIGLRQQPRLPVDQALAVSGCLAEHRDISLNF